MVVHAGQVSPALVPSNLDQTLHKGNHSHTYIAELSSHQTLPCLSCKVRVYSSLTHSSQHDPEEQPAVAPHDDPGGGGASWESVHGEHRAQEDGQESCLQ